MTSILNGGALLGLPMQRRGPHLITVAVLERWHIEGRFLGEYSLGFQRLRITEVDSGAVICDLYVVVEYGNFQTGVKIRCPTESIAEIGAMLVRHVQTQWQTWDPSLGSLVVHVNGQSGC